MYSVEVLRRVGVCHVAVQAHRSKHLAGGEGGEGGAGAAQEQVTSVKVVGRRWLHIAAGGEEGGEVQIDLGQHAGVRPQDTPAPTITAAGVVKFRFSLAGDLAVPGASAV